MLFLSRVSLANRRLVALLTVLLVALGIYAIPSLKQQLLPDLSFPAVTVVASYPGAAPEVVEEQVTGPIEKAVEGIDGVESTTSTSQQGSVQVMVSFSFDSDIDQASTDVEQAVSKISSALPAGVDPQVLTGSTADLPTMVLAATSGGDQHALAAALDEKVVPALRAVDGVNDVAISGVRDQIVTVTPDTAALSKAGLSTQSIVTALGALGGTSSAGQITSDGRNLSLAVGQPVTSLSQLQNMWLSPAASAGSPAAAGRPAAGPGGPAAPAPAAAAPSGAGSGKPVQLKQVATVALTDAPVTSITRTDGKPSLGISLTMDHGGSSPEISDDVRDQLPELQAALGDDARLVVVSDSGPGVKKAVNGLVEEGALGLLMAILVIVVFLRSARATVVTAVSIPLSLLVALIAVWLRDYSLNILTLGALTIAVGRVVDDSIVVLENIKRHLGYGEDRRSAVLSAVREVASAVTSSTLTTVAVFLPIALVGGFVGVLFGSFAITVSAAMLASLLVSLTVVPVLAYWFLKAPADAAGVPADEYRARVEERERQGLLPRVYLPVIRWAVGHRKTVLAGAVALLAATVVMAGGLKTTFLGDSGEDSIGVTQTLPAGTDLATTDAAAKKVEGVLASVDGVESYQVVIGSSGGFFGSRTANNVSYTLNLADGADSATVSDAVRDRIADITDAGELKLGGGGGPGGGGPGGDSTISVSIQADDDQALSQATRQVQEALTGVSQVTDVESDLSESAPQISIVPDGEAAARSGLTTGAIVSALRQSVEGTTVTQVTLDGAPRDVLVRTADTGPDSLAKVKALVLPAGTGTVRLDQVATVSRIDGPVQRTHVDGERTNTVTATPVGDNTGAASSAVTDKLETLTLPAGASYEIGGVTADQSEAFSQLILAMVAAIALVFLILVGVFRSIRQTLILLVSIPFAFVGAFALLLVTGTPLGVAALIGILMLIGIVVTNAIVLMDLVNQYRERGMSVAEAVVEGAQRRLRPILMTALATIFALLPMALGITGEGGFISTPLAVVVIGGLVTSTLLTLVLIPVLYTMVEGRRERRQARRSSPAPQPETVAEEPVPVA
ncbi:MULTISPECIES: efflux RND transporter permease subunit [Micromonospora]|uniref:efflux RND transporter permease subunit n=1 Tax=Micromonospora TaxID=1873 RepID=UPI00098D1D1E|nr:MULTISPECIES: efflux RND transporter permease subunit [unclassified Micromonospora]OON30904.1 hydrogenase expression protein [Micromonospora sp. Rc5]